MQELTTNMQELMLHQTDYKLPEIPDLTPKVTLAAAQKLNNEECHIHATNDMAAVNVWLEKHKSNIKTYTAYKREAERLLLWCVYVRGVTLSQLKAEDFSAYFDFLQDPPQDWCITRKELRKGRGDHTWRPFLGPLRQGGFNLAVRALNSLMNFLVAANYLQFNPIRLTKKTQNFVQTLAEQKYNVWSRMLEEDEWQAIQQTLESLPEDNPRQATNKIRTQFLFALLYFLGLRIHELASHSWNSFRYREERWYFFCKRERGKISAYSGPRAIIIFCKNLPYSTR